MSKKRANARTGEVNIPADNLILRLLRDSTPAGNEPDLYPIIEEVAKPRALSMTIDECGNVIVDMVKKPQTVFTAHLDDVSWKGERKRALMCVNGIISVKGGGILGADDKAGVWILLKMIQAGVLGRYIFTVGEECGGVGSNGLDPKYLKGIKRAIGFDRKGYTDIITHQGSRCCSDKFGEALAAAIGGMETSDRGIFTDTANWTDLVPECTNVSVGYQGAHTKKETLDYWWLSKCLLPRLLKVRWDALPTVRDPKAKDEEDRWGSSRWWAGYDKVIDIKGKSSVKKWEQEEWARWDKDDEYADKTDLIGADDAYFDQPLEAMKRGIPCPWSGEKSCDVCRWTKDCDYADTPKKEVKHTIDPEGILSGLY